jgi:hypothetical protein
MYLHSISVRLDMRIESSESDSIPLGYSEYECFLRIQTLLEQSRMSVYEGWMWRNTRANVILRHFT